MAPNAQSSWDLYRSTKLTSNVAVRGGEVGKSRITSVLHVFIAHENINYLSRIFDELRLKQHYRGIG